MDKKKVLIALIVLGLLLSIFTLNAGAHYVGSKNSDVYHYPSCHYVDRIKSENLIYFDTPEDAIAAGYRPCKVCKPPPKSSLPPTPSLSAPLPVHNMNTGENFSKIQAAIEDNDTKDGHTITVYSGVYYENVVVNKSVTLIGIGHPVVDAGGEGSAITLCADGITLIGFTATNSGSSWGCAGIKVISSNNIITGNNASNNNRNGIFIYDSSDNNSITSNNVNSNNYDGIYLDYSSNSNTITGNNASNNNWDGIRLLFSSNNIITGNNASNNNRNAIGLYSSSNNNTITGNVFVNDGLNVEYSYQNTVEDNTVNGKPLVYLEDASDYKVEDAGQVILVNCDNITVENLDLSNTSVGIELHVTADSKVLNNTVSNNSRDGIRLYDSHDNRITGNNVNNNWYGIRFDRSSNNNTITGNNASNNNWYGILLHYSSNNNTITGNNASNNRYGICLWDSSNNTITGNNASNNNWYGISLDYSSNNTIYFNNFINNTDNVHFYTSTTIWNSPFEITYTYDGTTYKSYLGNYWDGYEGTDAEGDGIGDTHYNIDTEEDESDDYPLMKPFENYFA